MWSLTHGMRETVNRRFMFGYTIEDANMRLWFASRSDIIVSEQFNFITVSCFSAEKSSQALTLSM